MIIIIIIIIIMEQNKIKNKKQTCNNSPVDK